ncbi:retrovirus-related pol polyprotein from transposon TNT 1-94 [Tanacetum coccineum]
MATSSLVCLMSKATSTKSWLWHSRFSHLNFGTINQLSKNKLVDGLPRFKYDKDHLCFAYEQEKSKKATFPSKLVPSINSKLELLHMDLCGPMRVKTVNGEHYIMEIIQRNMKAQVLKIWSDNGTEFKNATLKSFYEKLGILHQTSIARTPQQNGVVERRNRTLVEALVLLKNHSLVHPRYNKTPYELIKGRKPNVQYFYVFGSLCYLTNDCDDLGKIKPKADIGIFVSYSKSLKGFRVYNRRTKKIMETIHVKFDELTAMASECNNSGPGVNCSNFQDSSEEMNDIPSQQDLDNLFGPMYEEYYALRNSEVSDNSIANTLDNEDTPSSSSIIVHDNDALQIVTSSEETIAQESSTPVFDSHSNEQIQEDLAELDRNIIMHSFRNPEFEEAESSLNYQDPPNMHEFHQQHRYTDKWTKIHPIKQVIGDPSKPVTTRSRLRNQGRYA